MKIALAVVGAVVLVVLAYVFVQYRTIQEAAACPAKEITSSRMEKKGDTWHAELTSKIEAPLDKVFDAFQHPERAVEFVPENVMKSEIVEDKGNTKVVEVVGRLDILPPGFKVQNLRTEYTIYPAEHRITSKSIDFKLADINSEYNFEPTSDGKTLLKFTQTSKQKQQLIVEALQKGALCETYATQVRAVNRALGLAPKATTTAEG
ncbi:MAG TPA: SRPBCC family protein [Candidatus Binatia bacterium]|nr:SRPBCC family protein [Candidatus Binatia bacterium]